MRVILSTTLLLALGTTGPALAQTTAAIYTLKGDTCALGQQFRQAQRDQREQTVQPARKALPVRQVRKDRRGLPFAGISAPGNTVLSISSADTNSTGQGGAISGITCCGSGIGVYGETDGANRSK